MPASEHLIIDGKPAAAQNSATVDSYDPSTGEVLAQLALASAGDVDQAVQSARRAFESPAWRGSIPAERGRILTRIAQRIRDRAEELALNESLDTGKPLRQARIDVAVAARYFEFYSGVADKIMGTSIPLGPGFTDFTVREPIGVSAQIVPWNYPIQIGSRGIAPALAVGCTVVVKPSSEASLNMIRVAEIALECGLPPGVLNVVTGTGSITGAALASHAGIDQLTFTGSVEVGVSVATAAAKNIVPVVMELGGKSPNIVFADADFDLATKGVAMAIFQNAGQTCAAGARLLVERRAHDEFVERLAAHARSMTIGPGIDDPDMGPVISRRQLNIVDDYVQLGRAEGGSVIAGGKRCDRDGLRNGYFYEPTLIDGVNNRMRVAREEIFGPVLTIMSFDTVEEAIAMGNDSEYGLVAGVWTRNVNQAHAVAAGLRTGQVFVNTFGAGGGVELPFGGYKKSGYGREKGLESLATYTQVKNVCIKYA